MRYLATFSAVLFICAVCFLLWLGFGPYLQSIKWLAAQVPIEEDLESLFAPAAALFSGLAAGFTVYAILKQGKQFHQQQFEGNFFSLLAIHRENRKDLSHTWLKNSKDTNENICPVEVHGANAFHALYVLLRTLWERVQDRKRPSEYKLDQRSLDALQEQLGQYNRDKCGNTPLNKHQLFTLCYAVFRERTNYILYDYFRHLYHLIKYTHNNAPFFKRKDYMGIIRAQFAPYEYLLIYYHVLLFELVEKDEGSSKFQRYLEKNCLLHNMQRDLKFDSKAAGVYHDSAFNHIGLLSWCQRGISWWPNKMDASLMEKLNKIAFDYKKGIY